MESERDQLRSHVSELEGIQEAVEGEVAQLRGKLEAEETRSRALEASRREVSEVLFVSDKTHKDQCSKNCNQTKSSRLQSYKQHPATFV